MANRTTYHRLESRYIETLELLEEARELCGKERKAESQARRELVIAKDNMARCLVSAEAARECYQVARIKRASSIGYVGGLKRQYDRCLDAFEQSKESVLIAEVALKGCRDRHLTAIEAHKRAATTFMRARTNLCSSYGLTGVINQSRMSEYFRSQEDLILKQALGHTIH